MPADQRLQSLFNQAVNKQLNGDYREALTLLREALCLAPGDPDILNNLGMLYKRLGDPGAAEEAFEKALQSAPRNGLVHFNLANLLRETGRLENAVGHYWSVVAVDPRDHEAFKNLALAYLQSGFPAEARQACAQSLLLRPEQAEVHYNLGLVEITTGNWHQAYAALQQAWRLNPASAETCLNLGTVSENLGNSSEAEAWFRKALELRPDLADAYYNLGLLFERLNDLQKELEIQERALAICPEQVQTWIGGLRAFSKIADWPRLEPLFRKTIAHNFSAAEESLLSSALYLWQAFPLEAGFLAQKHRAWGAFARQKFGRRANRLKFDFQALKTSFAKIRIGYVSPDFCRHSVGWFFRNLLQEHDAHKFEIFCYATGKREDDLTREIAHKAAGFIRVSGWTLQQTAETIYRDRIQILVDLTGHTRNHRLDVFALKPAPIQATAFGYPDSSGLEAMDYRITDFLAEGPEARDHYTEKLVFLSRCFLPLSTLPVAPLPSARPECKWPAEGILLVSFNRLGKLSPDLLRLWYHILERCPEARLAVGGPYNDRPDARVNLLSWFSNPETRARVFFPERAKSEEEHRARYALADLALDSFPYSGTTTSYEALYMNVPVITLAGARHAQRTTYSLLKHLGLEETIAYTGREYIERTVALVREPDRLRTLKSRLREALQKTLAQQKDYVRELEQAYAVMWQRYLNNEPPREIVF